MSIDWINFTPWTSLAGGALIGLAASLFILFNGRIAGISGIIGGLVKLRPHETGWRIAFIIGLVAAPIIWRLLAQLPTIQLDSDFRLVAIAGLLVGVGTRFGAGCTSGHGVCGISRLSPRALIATLGFMAAGFITVYLMRHLIGM